MLGKKLTSILRIAFTFAGTLIGAGFASGQELLQFFITYGSFGFGGIIFAGMLFSLLAWRLLTLSQKRQLSSYADLIYTLCGKKSAYFFEGTIFCFLFAVLAIMLAGSGNIVGDVFALPNYYGYVPFSLLIIIANAHGFTGIAKINTYVTPFLAAIIIIISIHSLTYHHFSFDDMKHAALYANQPAPHWLLACILYVSYNMILSSTILVPLGKTTADKSVLKYGSFLGGIMLAFLSFLIVSTLLMHSPAILAEPFPMFTISCSQNQLHAILYITVLMIAMFTTSLSCLYGCANKLSALLPVGYLFNSIFIITAALCFTEIGFSQLIATVFPFFGYISLWLLLKLIFKQLPK